jgi:alkylation response protein AidB-like acyl-CoA dehydrogenase
VDFNLDETQSDLRGLAAEVLGREAATARVEAHEKSGQAYDGGAWKALAQAGLLGACLPGEAGGAGLGTVEMAVILREAGARVAPVPLLSSLVTALTIGKYGSAAQKQALAPLAEGEIVLTAALRQPGSARLADAPSVTARQADGGFLLDGRTSVVPYAAEASRVLVPARVEGGHVALFLVDPQAAAVDAVPASTAEPCGVLTFTATPAEPLGEPNAGTTAAGLRRFGLAGIVATASGGLAGALDLTTAHIKARRQFGRALAEFQAVTMQIADVYIAKRALDATMWSGAWRVDRGLDDEAELDLSVAAYTTADTALRALYTCQHLHGGLGLDVTYPLHRYFAQGKHCAHLLGGLEAQLDTIGALA